MPFLPLASHIAPKKYDGSKWNWKIYLRMVPLKDCVHTDCFNDLQMTKYIQGVKCVPQKSNETIICMTAKATKSPNNAFSRSGVAKTYRK